MKTIVLTGGGTAGHIMPNIALLPELKKHFDRICYIGTDGMEKEIAQKNNIEFFTVSATKLIRKLTIKNLFIPFKLLKSIKQAKKILKIINPDVIFSKGGYVSVPIAIAGKKLKIPVVSHESDFSIGLANKIITKYSSTVCTSFEETAKYSNKCVCTGSPIRESIFKGNKQNIIQKYKLDNCKPTILFLGGSLGSVALNEAVYNNIDKLLEKYNVLHIAGKNLKKLNKNNYVQIQFTNEIEDFYSAADLVVCRSGANTLFELLALNKPMLLIPLPRNQSRGDQIENAEYFRQKKFANVLEQANISMLLKYIENTLKNKKYLIEHQKLSKANNANKKIIDIILLNLKNK